MSTNVPNQTPFLRRQRLFPQEMQPLTVEVDRAYTDIASAVNARTLGVYTNNNFVQTGDIWYENGQQYSGFRQYYLTTTTGNIPHGLNLDNIFAFTKIYGAYTNGTNWYPLPFVDDIGANDQISLYITPTNIVLAAGSGPPPTLVRGSIVLEWIGLSI